jgi:adenine-specific DNA glycosylase
LEIPPRRVRPAPTHIQKTLLLFRRRREVLLTLSSRVKGFWELPEPDTAGLDIARIGKKLGVFRHAIMNRLYTFEVREASLSATKVLRARRFRWCSVKKLEEIPLSTAARKALSGLR